MQVYALPKEKAASLSPAAHSLFQNGFPLALIDQETILTYFTSTGIVVIITKEIYALQKEEEEEEESYTLRLSKRLSVKQYFLFIQGILVMHMKMRRLVQKTALGFIRCH